VTLAISLLQQSPSFEIGVLIESSVTVMPFKKFPVRLTSTHCTTGSFPITVHPTLVFPLAPVSV
jgi:hypothetical protein